MIKELQRQARLREYKADIDSTTTKSYLGFVLFEVRYRCVVDPVYLKPGDMNKDVSFRRQAQHLLKPPPIFLVPGIKTVFTARQTLESLHLKVMILPVAPSAVQQSAAARAPRSSAASNESP